MSPVEASCPGCGAPITFTVSTSLVAVCQYCNSAVARGDRKLEDLGKVVDLVETGSPLDIGLKGVYKGSNFELMGRAQIGHPAGGLWDEWYAAFDDGRWGWITEAQGEFYITFRVPAEDRNRIPPPNELAPGMPMASLPGSVPFTVAEVGEGRMLGAKGEIPYMFVPGETYFYADLSGPNGEFATLDYSEDAPIVFVGRVAQLADLGFPPHVRAPERDLKRVSALQLKCPHCSGPLELRAPDRTERVACPNCGTLLDVNQGNLTYFRSFGPAKLKPVIPLGAVGQFGEHKLTLIGFMRRSTQVEGQNYYWDEYLLYAPELGFAWLVTMDNHWSFVLGVATGKVLEEIKQARYHEKKYKLFQDGHARVEYVLGEFYWKVTPGEVSYTADYINPPEMLSKEYSTVEGSEEVVRDKHFKAKRTNRPTVASELRWSLCTYKTVDEIESIFGLKGLPRPFTIAPNQPFYINARQIYKYWAIFSMLAILVWLGMTITTRKMNVYEKAFVLPKLANNTDSTQVAFSEKFEMQGRRNIKVTVQSPVSNSWVYVEGDLINEDTGLVQPFSAAVEYYSGYEDGSYWTEGNTSTSEHISAVPAGTYSLRIEAQWGQWQQPVTVNVKIEQGLPRFSHLLWALLALSIIPIIVAILQSRFEMRRWSDSRYNPYAQSE